MTNDVDNFLAHYGVKGMKWGVRRSSDTLARTSKPGYSIDPDGRITISKGHKLQRVHNGANQNNGATGANYFSFTDKDNNIYTQMMGAGAASKFALLRKLASNTVTSLEAVEELRSPSREEAFNILKATIDEVPSSKRTNTQFKKDFSDKRALDWYRGENARIVLNRESEVNKKYFENLRKSGFNILLDEADTGVLSELPILVLDGAKSLKPVSVSEINGETLQSAKKFLKENDGVMVRKLEDFTKSG